MNEKIIERIAKKILAEVKVDYTEKNSAQHVFKKGSDTIRLYHNPTLNKPFTAVISGKDWDEPGSTNKTLITFNDKGATSIRSGKEDASLGKPAVFANLPANLKQAVFKLLSGKYEED